LTIIAATRARGKTGGCVDDQTRRSACETNILIPSFEHINKNLTLKVDLVFIVDVLAEIPDDSFH
jgi:hypothetical protein